MLKRTMLFWAQYILVLPILLLTFMFTGFVGSQLMIGADKQYFIFTPQNATEYSQISEIDKFLFSFSIQPAVTIVFLLSIVYVLTLLVFQIMECKKQRKILHSLQYMILIPIFLYVWLGTMKFSAVDLTWIDNWKDYLIFTPATITNEQDIYMIDKFLYKFRMLPIRSTVLILSFIYMLILIVIDSVRLLKKCKK
ncbi:DUF4306 domain-containing protein [Bacillus mobilis]|uniref:DUF4306 domain-containing protein n=1 Tax=Bacillus cereus group TaxID=86661 RepID=UPI0008FDF61A|nr:MULTISPECIES: DUF4306 domain-containing protein [Bacillus cereus group]MDG1620773.1 DUF4306 domain-containing protein [Bacillus mobilis]MDX5840281.1 DUF4306 domain-containing protein [Bacillus cereus group sp. BfR-BA-01700]MED0950433.1 DUF4306 domain-containing protein [Bacillus mobilis]MED0994694.1 DUF4306 domain-containing protein [Bacillus mobilis]MED1002444.1 DUF4306 domain-containing protein [Bacillus mobilis]